MSEREISRFEVLQRVLDRRMTQQQGRAGIGAYPQMLSAQISMANVVAEENVSAALSEK